MMQALLDSLGVARQNSGLLFFLLLCIFWGSLITFALLKRCSSAGMTDSSLGGLALAGWPLPLLILSILLFLLSLVLPLDIALFLIFLAAGAATILSLRLLWRNVSGEVLIPVGVFLAMALIRIGYVAGAILPPYFDSAQHYDLIASIARMEHGTPIQWPTHGYYHLGYHVILAGLYSTSQASLARLMLLFGQLVLACLLVPFIFYVRTYAGSRYGWMVGVGLAGFGWSMPAHAVDWGKYPALLSLLMLEFTLGLAMIRQKLLLSGSLLAALIFHTRSFLIAGLAVLGKLIYRLSNRWMAGVLLLSLGTEIFWLQRDPLLWQAIEPYLGAASVLAVLLGCLAAWQHPTPVLAALFMVVATLGSLFIPAWRSLTLLDRPLVQSFLFFPLAFVAGLGAGRIPKPAVVIVMAGILMNALATQSFSPSACCQLAGRDDVVAIDWIARNLPEAGRIGIATADLRLASNDLLVENAGSDAGIWIRPLTGRWTVGLPFSTDFSRIQTLKMLCRKGVGYIYIGSKEMSFIYNEPAGGSQWYETILRLPQARVLRLRACP